jgi:hypothetical protein
MEMQALLDPVSLKIRPVDVGGSSLVIVCAFVGISLKWALYLTIDGLSRSIYTVSDVISIVMVTVLPCIPFV